MLMRDMRSLVLVFSLMWFVTARAEAQTVPPGSNRYQNTDYHFRITFPEGWTFVKPIETFTQIKARAPKGNASMSVARRESLWRDDSVSTQYADAWAALDGISISTFTNKFERNVPTQSPSISTVEKTILGIQKAIKVDYVLSDTAKNLSVRIRAFFVLRGGHGNSWRD
jgi:hypothetical protein